MHLEQFPVDFLALLARRMREQLLWNLPVADVCLLEVTQFTNGMNMDDYWSIILDANNYTDAGFLLIRSIFLMTAEEEKCYC